MFISLLLALANTSNDDKGLELGPQKDDDPDGSKLLKATDLLDKAWKFLSPLASLEVKNVDVWLAVYDVSVRQSTYPNPPLRFFGYFF